LWTASLKEIEGKTDLLWYK